MTAPRRGGWPGPRKIQKVVPQHPNQVSRVQAYAEREGVTYAEAMRRLVDSGLGHQDAPTLDVQAWVDRERQAAEKRTADPVSDPRYCRALAVWWRIRRASEDKRLAEDEARAMAGEGDERRHG